MVILIWIQTGFAMVILSAALRGVPEETLEAARIDGANGFQIFFGIMIPQIWGTHRRGVDHDHHHRAQGVRHRLRDDQRRVPDAGARQPHVPLDVHLRRLRARLDHRGDHHARGACRSWSGTSAAPTPKWGHADDLDRIATCRSRSPRRRRPTGCITDRRGQAQRPHRAAVLRRALDLPDRRPPVSSVRDKDQLAVSGWWTALDQFHAAGRRPRRPRDRRRSRKAAQFVIRGNLLGDDAGKKQIQSFGTTNADVGRAIRPAARRRCATAARSPCRRTATTSGRRPRAFTHTNGPRIYYVVGSPPRFTLDNYRRGAVGGGRRAVLHQLDHGRHSGDRHPDPDRGLRRLCAGVDALPVPRADRRGGRRPAGRAAADVADPAAPDLQRHRQHLRHREQGLSRRLAGAHRVRPAARDLSLAQLHGGPAARRSWSRRASTAPRTSRSSPAWCCR